MKLQHYLFILIGLSLFSCDNSEVIKNPIIQSTSDSYINRPSGGRQLIWGTEIPIELVLRKIPTDLDSVYILIDNKTVFSSAEKKEKYLFNFKDSSITVGKHQIKTILKKKSGREDQYQTFTLLSDISPKSYSYTIVNKYPHDTKAYTQGLVFDNGILFEGTGLRGQSELRQLNYLSGTVTKKIPVINDLFGEGITIIGDKIYQLTYQANKGFVYNKQSFELIKEFTYTTEGWGLTTDGTSLIYSDGTEKIYYLDAENFKVIRTLEVYDDRGMQTRINELEFIEGEIWANIYTTDEIVKIDPATGKVTGRINMSGLLSPQEYQSGTIDVLNGIAYEAKSKKIFVTGKNFPWLWEVKIIES